MCGIVGLHYRHRTRAVARETIRRMRDAIIHRGPDDAGELLDGNVGMGMRRLSIIDLEGGHQPIYSEDGRIAVVFNGEIYNHQELRQELKRAGHRFATRSDTEVLVHGYEQWGVALPSKLNGIFAFSIWDARDRRLVLARDHLGVKPLYLYQDDRLIAWASEIKALLHVPEIARELDPTALRDLLAFGYVPAPRTLFRRIEKLPPATLAVVDQAGIRTRTYWDIAFQNGHRTASDWCDELRSLLDDAVKRQLMSDVPLGAFLSGGIDSSAIVATMRRLGVGRISTYAIGFNGLDAFHSETDKAARVARDFDTDHHEIIVEPKVAELFDPLIKQLDEPVTDTSFLVTYLVSKLARQSVTVILSGVGGDEIFAGYRRYLGSRLHRWYGGIVPRTLHRGVIWPLASRLPVDRGSRWKSMFRYARGLLEHAQAPEAERYQGYVSLFANGQLESLLTPDFQAHSPEYRPNRIAEYYDTAPSDDPLNRMFYADMKTALVDSLLAFTDKMSMAVSLEARVPLLDYRIVELAARIPPELRLRGLRGLKHIFRQALSDRLPQRVLGQKKQGFGTPISRWLRGELQPLVQELLAPERLAARGYFRPEAVRRLIDEHTNERADHSERLLALLTFESWHRTYLDRKAA